MLSNPVGRLYSTKQGQTYISEMFVEGIMVDLIIDLDISKCKSTTISQYGQIYFVDLPLCILNGIIAEPYSEVVFD